MTHRQTNILRVYHKANEEELRNGMEWYHSAHDEAERLASEHSLPVSVVSAIIAAVSPGLRWEKNIEAAERIIRRESLNGLGVRWYGGVRKAEAIRDGQNPSVALKGNKVRAFAECIRTPDTALSVCVDGHAYSIWAGRRIPLDEVPPINDRLYNRISVDYWEVAKHCGVRACQLQACVWVTWRRLHEV